MMDTQSGEVFRDLTPQKLRELRIRNPNIVPVSKKVADAVEIGMESMNRAERRRQERRRKKEEIKKRNGWD